jgi:hypothetical protein
MPKGAAWAPRRKPLTVRQGQFPIATVRPTPRWEAYQRELESYPEDPSAWESAIAPRRLRRPRQKAGRQAKRPEEGVAASIARFAIGAVGAVTPIGSAAEALEVARKKAERPEEGVVASIARFAVLGAVAPIGIAAWAQKAGIKGLLSNSMVMPAPILGEGLLQEAGIRKQPWDSVVKLESALAKHDDHGAVTLRVITLCEAIIRDLLWEGAPDPCRDAVVAHSSPRNREFLARVLGEAKGATLSVLGTWMSGLERAISKGDEVVLSFASERFADAPALAPLRLSSMIGRVVPERNALAHGADEEVTAERHEGVMRILVDCHRVGAWWTRGTTAKASIPGLLHARVYRST